MIYILFILLVGIQSVFFEAAMTFTHDEDGPNPIWYVLNCAINCLIMVTLKEAL